MPVCADGSIDPSPCYHRGAQGHKGLGAGTKRGPSIEATSKVKARYERAKGNCRASFLFPADRLHWLTDWSKPCGTTAGLMNLKRPRVANHCIVTIVRYLPMHPHTHRIDEARTPAFTSLLAAIR